MTVETVVNLDALPRALAEMEELRLGHEAAQLRAAIGAGKYDVAQALIDFVLGPGQVGTAARSTVAKLEQPPRGATQPNPDAEVSAAAEHAIVDERLDVLERRVGTHDKILDFMLDADEEHL